MPTLRVVYARSHSVLGLLTRHHDNVAPARWSHSGAIVDTQGHPFVVEAQMGHGVIVSSLWGFLARYPAHEIVEYEVPDAEAGDAWVCGQVGAPYDYLAVLGRLVRKSWDEPGRWHCQELVEARFVHAGRRRFRPSPALITPNLGYSVQ